MEISVVAPAYNEEAVIESFVEGVVAVLNNAFSRWELIVVDDGSTDRTKQILQALKDKHPGLKVISHGHNCGLGAGLETGFQAAQGKVVVTMDADGTHPPKLIPELYRAVINGADVAIASRYVNGGKMVGVPLWRQGLSILGNRTMKALRWPVNDATSGYRAYKGDIVKTLRGLKTGFEVQAEIVMRLRDKRFIEIPLELLNRTGGRSKMQYTRLIPAYLHLLVSAR
ncbi:MAG: glycosyltransferase family 2 protein [Syntrophothermus sp.]|nr:glycosyltransferase family 2 protein [Syntrophothermus sp.]